MKHAGFWGSIVGLTLAVACGTTTPAADSGQDAGGAGAGGEDGSASGGRNAGGGPADGGSSGGATGGSSGSATGGMGGATEGMGGDASASAQDFCDDYAQTLCDYADACLPWTTCEQWGGYLSATRECNDGVASIEGGYLDFDVEAASDCLSAATGLACGNPPFFEPAVRAVCRTVFVGTVEPGDECATAEAFGQWDECDGGFCERPENGTGGLECLGTCIAFKGDGDTCIDGDRCAPGLHCVNEECVPPSQLDEDCMETPCATGLACSGSESYTCRDPGGSGADCADDYDCIYPGVCDGDACAVEAAEGDLCRDHATCLDGLYCRASDSAAAVCAVPLSAAAPCDPSYDVCIADYECSPLEPYVCVESVAGLDEPCGPSGCAADLWCDPQDQMCRSLGGEGADCPSSDACAYGMLCMADAQCHAPGDVEEPCNPDYYSTCIDSLFCDRETRLCKSPRGEGEACSPLEAYLSCQDGLYCACLASGCPYTSATHDPADVCLLKKDDGESCAGSDECAGGYCTGEECTSEVPTAMNCSR